MRVRTLTAVAIGIALLTIGGVAAAGATPAPNTEPKASAAKETNPLAGKWVGTTQTSPSYSGPIRPITYRITNRGRVLDFSITGTLNKAPSGDPCPTPIEVTQTMPSVKMEKPTDFYPKGKRWQWDGPSTEGLGQMYSVGKTISGFRSMEGAAVLGQLGGIATPSGPCRSGNISWTARRK